MEKLWFCFVLLTVGASTFDEKLDNDYSDEGNYDYLFDLSDQQGAPKENSNKVEEAGIASLDVIKGSKNEEDIHQFFPDNDKAVDALNADYQIEDNRSAPKEDENLPDARATRSQQEKDEVVTDIKEFKEAAEFSSEEDNPEIALVTNIKEFKEAAEFSSEEENPEIALVTNIKEFKEAAEFSSEEENPEIALVTNIKEFKEAAEFSSEEEAPEIAVLADVDDSDKDKIIGKTTYELPKLKQQNDKIINFVAENDTGVQENTQFEEISFDVNSNIKPLPLLPKMIIEEIGSKTEKNVVNDFNVNKHIEETKKILEELDNESKEDNGFAQEAEKDAMQLTKSKDEPDFDDTIAEDTVDKVYDDLLDDLDKLSSTWKKLSIGESLGENNADDSINPDNVQEYEDKYNRPYREEAVLSQRYDYYEDMANQDNGLDFKDLTEKDADDADGDNISTQEEDISEVDDADFNDSLVDNYEGNIFEKMTSVNADDGALKDIIPEENVDVKSEKTPTVGFDTDERAVNIKADKQQSVDDNDQISNDKPIFYLKDALAPNDDDQSNDKDKTTSQSQVTRTMDVSELNPEQNFQLMEQFKALHEDELDVHSESFGRNVAVQHVTLSLDEPVVIQSPNYPAQYPTNNIVDWIFEGDGIGIEMNITDFSVNGFFGDYLLVKPGGVDQTGTDGLVFSYRLNEPRRYRFLDVNRMFVRFEARPGNAFFTGFQFSVKMVSPLPVLEEILPEPEAVIPEPKETISLILGGMDTIHFNLIHEEFRVLVADMATLYINANDIDPGSNTTYETTQITNVRVCNIHWPDFENCAEITFAVPIVYDDDEGNYDPRLSSIELKAMWETYSTQDPFAARLRRMGLTEFTSPNDSSVLMVWLVISVGVLVCMALLAVALWRYSCVDTYTRMPEFSNQDSGYNEKQALDLYPTPHQTLPPLYESDYKWADVKYQDSTRVDMGGFANKSFTRDELFDIESDEDVISTRDRKLEFSVPKDASKV